MKISEFHYFSDQFFYFKAPVSDGFKNHCKVPVFCPPNIGQGIINSFMFIIFVVPAWAIGTGYLEGKFFFIKIGPGNIKTYHPHQYDPSTFATHSGSL